MDYEQLTPYRAFFHANLPPEFLQRIYAQPLFFAAWVRDSIRLIDDHCLKNCPISPIGVYASRMADRRSRDIFFVSVMRAAGRAARVHPVTGQVQYANDAGVWQSVFEEIVPDTAEKADTDSYLQLTYTGARLLPDPEYYAHFTLSRHEKNGFRLQTYPEDGSVTYKSSFTKPQPFQEGYYLLVSGTRLAGGDVLAQLHFFNVKPRETSRIPLVMRDDPDRLKVIGSFNAETPYFDIAEEKIQSILQQTGRGYFVLAVLGVGEEPTDHALHDLSRLKTEMEAWGRPIIALFKDKAAWLNYRKHPVENLPATLRFGIDQENAAVKELTEKLDLQERNLPLFIVCDTFNRVVFVSQGYNINLGEQLLKAIRQL